VNDKEMGLLDSEESDREEETIRDKMDKKI